MILLARSTWSCIFADHFPVLGIVGVVQQELAVRGNAGQGRVDLMGDAGREQAHAKPFFPK